MNMDDCNIRKPASVIILTGFLGAGKTTLLNRILTAEHGRRIAVIVNEFGDVGIDHDLLIASDQEVVQLNNGCICCSVRGDLLRGLFELAAQRSKFDTVVIETSGLAEPGPVVQALYADEGIRRDFTLGGIVTVVDAKHIRTQLQESAEAREQIAVADLILINKTDLSTPQGLDQLEEEIGHLNRVAKIQRAKNSDIDLTDIFNMESIGLTERGGDTVAHADCSRHHHLHVSTVCITETGDLDGLKMSMWLRSLNAEFGARILRMKGILSLHEDPDQFQIQGVQTEIEGRPGRAWRAGEERVNKLVLIGRNLDQPKITRGFNKCFFTGTGDTAAGYVALGRSSEISPLTLEQIRYWMRQNFGFPKGATIVIKEVPCIKPGCPPIETTIMAILKNEPPRVFKVQHTINDITFDHVYDLMENPMPCC